MVIPHDTPIPTGPPDDIKNKPIDKFLEENNLTKPPKTLEFPIKDNDGLKVSLIFSRTNHD